MPRVVVVGAHDQRVRARAEACRTKGGFVVTNDQVTLTVLRICFLELLLGVGKGSIDDLQIASDNVEISGVGSLGKALGKLYVGRYRLAQVLADFGCTLQHASVPVFLLQEAVVHVLRLFFTRRDQNGLQRESLLGDQSKLALERLLFDFKMEKSISERSNGRRRGS